MYFYGHEIVAPLTLTKHDSSLTLRGFRRTRGGLQPTPELVLLQFHPKAPPPPPNPDEMPDSNMILVHAAGAYGRWARKGGANRNEAADSVVAYLRRSDRVKSVARGSGSGYFVKFRNGEEFVMMGDEDPTHVPPTVSQLIDGEYEDFSRSLDAGVLILVLQSGRMLIPDGQRDFPDSLLRHPTSEMADRLKGMETYLDDSIPLDRFALRTKGAP